MASSHIFQRPLESATTTINPADFVPSIDNPYFTLRPGTTFTTESPDGSEIGKFVVTRDTKVIDGVTCVVVRDTSTVDGDVSEKTLDYFAQDKSGNVWYFGEDTKEFEDGKVVSTEGSWRAGVDDASPGIVMLAAPHVGNQYDQENAVGVAEDHAEVLSLSKTVSVPYGTFHHVLQTLESSPLDAGFQEEKHYAAGVGFVLAIDASTGEPSEQLVKVEVEGTSRDNILLGYAGGDELNGHDGNDLLDGLGGRDTINGGTGNDTLDGGDDSVGDVLHGGAGRDAIVVGLHDQAFGDSGNDLLRLFGNAHFDAIDGGTQPLTNLRNTSGDVLQIDVNLDLTAAGVSERIVGIETVSMTDTKGNDSLRLSAHDVLDLGDGVFNPIFNGHDAFGLGGAVRISGDSGDRVYLSGANWQELDPSNAPHDFSVFGCHSSAGDAYVLVQEDLTVNTSG